MLFLFGACHHKMSLVGQKLKKFLLDILNKSQSLFFFFLICYISELTFATLDSFLVTCPICKMASVKVSINCFVCTFNH